METTYGIDSEQWVKTDNMYCNKIINAKSAYSPLMVIQLLKSSHAPNTLRVQYWKEDNSHIVVYSNEPPIMLKLPIESWDQLLCSDVYHQFEVILISRCSYRISINHSA